MILTIMKLITILFTITTPTNNTTNHNYDIQQHIDSNDVTTNNELREPYLSDYYAMHKRQRQPQL
jgi:hypothetical protein